jgi:hypothetical protein
MKADSKRLCPRSGSSEVFRSHRRTVERYLLRAIGVRPFRCGNCDARFIGSSAPTAPNRSISERPNETVLQSRKESDHALCDCHSDIHRSCLKAVERGIGNYLPSKITRVESMFSVIAGFRFQKFNHSRLTMFSAFVIATESLLTMLGRLGFDRPRSC